MRNEDGEVGVSLLPAGWPALVRETGVLKGLRKDKSLAAVRRVLLLHLAGGPSRREPVVRARKAHLSDWSAVALVKRRRKSAGGLRALCIALFRE